ncbi:MAG: 16S rRNA (uracil(1498)-N(3))-methyltransferase [Spirochaetaceae bacterium]|nr:16S rRNA (uracil(1498)-N(3))-methyltransferase [Spirochaetaceae bacterium]
MKQFILRNDPPENGELCLTGDEFHYLARVRRVRAGDILNCRLPSGSSAFLRITKIEKNALFAECAVKTNEPSQTLCPPVILFQAMAKGAKMDLIVRQAAEAGVSEIAPFYSERSIPRPTVNSAAANTETERCRRWNRILIEARQQSGSSAATSLRPPQNLDVALEYWENLKNGCENPLALLIHETPLAKGGFHRYLNTIPELIVLAVGPEGGFSAAETAVFMASGFKPVTLGDTILRTESAALYAVAVVRTLIFERRMWTTANL